MYVHLLYGNINDKIIKSNFDALKKTFVLLIVLLAKSYLLKAKTKDGLYEAARSNYVTDKTSMHGISPFNCNPNNHISINGFKKTHTI